MNQDNIGIRNVPFRRHVLKMNSRSLLIKSPQSFIIRMLVISWPWALFESRFLIIWRMSFLEKWQLANEFSVSKVNCDGNTFLLGTREHCSAKTGLKISLFFFKSIMYLLFYSWKLVLYSYILELLTKTSNI